MYWHIDQLALAADAWQRANLEPEDRNQPRLHPAFEPTEFPTPPEVVSRNAKRFVCDVLTRTQGTVIYPGASTHPPAEQRLRKIAEALRPVADKLPSSGGHRDFQPITKLQQGVSPIFALIHRETGVYLEAIHERICSIVNGPQPQSGCP